MATDTFLSVMTILTPTSFVLALGYAAGRYHVYDAEKSKGVTDLVLDFALPATLFIAIVTAPRQELLQAIPLFQAFFLVSLPTYILVLVVTTRLFHQSVSASSIAALLVTFPSSALIGPSIVGGLFGISSGK